MPEKRNRKTRIEIYFRENATSVASMATYRQTVG